MRRRKLALTLVLLSVAVSAAAQSPPPADQAEVIQKLLARIDALEKRVAELEARPAPPQAAAAKPAPEPAPVPITPPPEEQRMGMSAGNLQIRGFSDIGFQARDNAAGHSAFSLGQFDLFITSKLSDRVNVLAEAVLEAGTDNHFGFELERLLLQVAANDYFNVAFGRYHTAIGFYNTAYHHSTWMQTAIERPFLFAFEDEGGILPVHNVGASATGRIPSGTLGLHYIAEIGNGRRSMPVFIEDRVGADQPIGFEDVEPVQNVTDENNRKAFNLGLYARPDALPGFQAGFSLYRDRLTPVLNTVPFKIGETIFAGHAVYQRPSFEFLNEVVVVRHGVAGARVFNTPAFYTQLSQRWGMLRPYFRYQYLNAPSGDPLFGTLGRMHGPALGVRYDFNEMAAFKVQYDRFNNSPSPSFNRIATQIAFTF